MDIIVDPEFEHLIRPLSEQELRQLECSLLDDGALSPLAVWAPQNILLDGHHRLRLCRKHGIPFTTAGLEFDSRDAAREWIKGHQIGRRNLSPEEAAYIRGEKYRRADKQPGARTDLALSQAAPAAEREAEEEEAEENTSCHCDTKCSSDTAGRLAKEHGVSPRTIKRDARFTEALDALAAFLGAAFRRKVLAGTSGLSRKDIVTLAGLPRESVTEAGLDAQKLHELAELWRKGRRNPAHSTPDPPPAPVAEEGVPEAAAGDGQDYHDALVNILWVCGQVEETLVGLRGQLEQISGIAREALGQPGEELETEPTDAPPLITDEDLL